MTLYKKEDTITPKFTCLVIKSVGDMCLPEGKSGHLIVTRKAGALIGKLDRWESVIVHKLDFELHSGLQPYLKQSDRLITGINDSFVEVFDTVSCRTIQLDLDNAIKGEDKCVPYKKITISDVPNIPTLVSVHPELKELSNVGWKLSLDFPN